MIAFSNFESGAANFIKWDNNVLRVTLPTNQKGEVNHWFYFGVKDAPRSLTIIFENGMLSRFAKGWYEYRPYISVDNIAWVQCDTVFAIDGLAISIKLNNLPHNFYLAWYPPYGLNKYKKKFGLSDYICQVGNRDGESILITARQHPGETMGSFFIEGLYDFIRSSDSEGLLRQYNFIIVPFVNIDGVEKGMHRTSYDGTDYNFAWFGEYVDEINKIKEFISDKTIILYFDIHGDEISKINYMFYTGKNKKRIWPLLNDLQVNNRVALLHRSKLWYILKTLLKKRKIIFGIKNTVEYIEKKKGCAGFVYELSAHTITPEECRIQGKNLGLSINRYLLTK